VTATAAGRAPSPSRSLPSHTTLLVGAVAIVGCGLLAARPALVAATPFPVLVLVALFVALLAGGAGCPLPIPARAATTRSCSTAPAVLVGVAAFALGRVFVGGRPPTSATAFLIAANTLAAVAEEAWFRRLCFGLLLPAGEVFAVLGSTVLFAAVHVSIYGYWVLPLDLAAGLLLGWQRAVTGSWTAPALTHAIANVLVVL
jgi:Type II CAAX prenyl endopeptidase Rce1-like